MTQRQATIETLYRRRPRRPFVSGSMVGLTLVIVVSWLVGNFQVSSVFSERQQTNAARFLGELKPWPLQQETAPQTVWGQVSMAGQWFGRMWHEKGAEAVMTTLAMSLVAILLAGLLGGLMSLLAARNIATAEPFLKTARARCPRRWC